jgi:hypothetical protein
MRKCDSQLTTSAQDQFDTLLIADPGKEWLLIVSGLHE